MLTTLLRNSTCITEGLLNLHLANVILKLMFAHAFNNQVPFGACLPRDDFSLLFGGALGRGGG